MSSSSGIEKAFLENFRAMFVACVPVHKLKTFNATSSDNKTGKSKLKNFNYIESGVADLNSKLLASSY